MRYLFLLAILFITPLFSDDGVPSEMAKKAPFASFTGKITKDRVRMRLAPNLDSHIFKELNRDDLVLVVGADDDFYALMPPQNLKSYIYRTYVIDNVVEGTNVNIRLEPDISAPVVAQLNTGDQIAGKVAPQSNKWLQIEPPKGVRFYVAKEFVTKAGDETLFFKYQLREKETKKALQVIENELNQEFEKPFSQIQLNDIALKLQEIIVQNKDLPREVAKAQSLMQRMEQTYLAKSLDMNKAKNSPEEASEVVAVTEELPENPNWQNPEWQQKEAESIALAIDNQDAEDEASFYEQEQKQAKRLEGVLKTNNRFVKNIPGDFVLVNPKTNLPVAYLYSTKVNLQNHVNKEVLVMASERPNNHFAFPAYFVLEVHE
jgi:hypothetical protein